MRSTSILFLLLLLGTTPSPLRATPFDEANAAFASGDYAKAAAISQNFIASQGPSAARLFHLGNAQFKLGQFGSAILSYERAALLAPRARDIQTNLKAARQAASTPDSSPSLTWWRLPLSWLSLREWSFLTVSGLLLTVLPLLT
jgi:tetratricopeptide (TPR) repeat protein